MTARSRRSLVRALTSTLVAAGIATPLTAQTTPDTAARSTTPSATPSTARSTARPISLTEAIQLSRLNNPQTVQARGAERTSQAAVRSAVGAFLPNVSVSAGASRPYGSRTFVSDSLGRSGGMWSYSNGFSVGMTLFDGRRFSDLKTARANVEAARATTVSQDYTVSLNVAQQYYNALSARESEEAARAQLAQAEAQLSVATRKVSAGSATRSDSLRAFVQVATARVALLTAQTNLRSANAALTRLVGSPDVVTAAPEPNEAVVPAGVDSAALVTLAMQGPAVTQARASLIAAEARQRASKAAYLPTLSASYSRSGSGNNSSFGFGSDPFNYGGQLSFSLSYPLFNQFNREEQIVQAKVGTTNANASLRDAERAAQQVSVQNLDALNTAIERVHAQQAAVTAAEEDLRVQQARYDLGLSTIVDVLTSQTQLNQARADLISARYDARIARAQIEALIGRDLSTLSSSPTR